MNIDIIEKANNIDNVIVGTFVSIYCLGVLILVMPALKRVWVVQKAKYLRRSGRSNTNKKRK